MIGIVLAAGAGSRMGRPKAEIRIDDVRLVDRAVAVLTGAGCRDVIAVVRRGTAVEEVQVVVNEQPERGMRSSLELGIARASQTGGHAVAVMLVDTPGVSADAARSVIEAWRPGRIAVPSYRGRRGHPIVMATEFWRRALELAGPDEGARAFVRTVPELVDEIDAAGDATDLDTAQDLAAWAARTAPD